MHSVEGFILVGGASSRMGTDKSLIKLGGRTFQELIADALSVVTNSVTLVGRSNQKRGTLNSVVDVHEKWGALGGLHTALANCKATWALVVACDLPFVSTELFERLVAFRKDFEAVAPIQSDGYPQPLCAAYRVAPCLDQCEKLIQAGERRPIALLDSVKTRWVAFRELSDLNGAASFFDNINTPEDYVRAQGERRELPS